MQAKRKKMKNLLKTDWENKYLDFVKGLDFDDKELQNEFLEMLKKKTINGRTNEWNKIRIKLSNLSEAVKIANPYYIGFGNPESEILFIGKEKAFSIAESATLFYKESINNVFQWKKLIAQNEPINHEKFYQDYGYNPQFPRMNKYGKVKKRKTWGMYAQIIAQLKKLDLDKILEENAYSENSFYRYCFSTEINYIPSKYSKNMNLNNNRETLLKDDFYKRFAKVIIGAKSIIKKETVSDIFGLDNNWETVELGEIGKKRKRKQKAFKWKNDSRTIIICDQLSGSAGWSEETLNNLIETIRN